MKIVRLYTSADHNFVGHHGKPPGDHPIVAADSVDCVAGQGIRGDRFFAYEDNYKGQITFFSLEVHRDLCRQLGVDADRKSTSIYRRNAITSGVDLNRLIGRDFELQGIRFHGTEECSPCYWMNHAFGAGAEVALKGNGGLRAHILSDGTLRTDAGEPASS